MNTVLVTGGTGALGSAVVQTLVARGYNCAVPYRTESEAQALRGSLERHKRDQLLLLEADLLDDQACERVVHAAADFGDFYALVHLLGGVRSFQSVAETAIEEWDFMMRFNLRAYFICARLAMQLLMRRGAGRIVGIASMQALKPVANSAGYGVAKAGVVTLTRILADEGRARGVTANAIAPSIIDTPANREWGSEEDVKTWVAPGDVAATIAYLLSEEGGTVNGSVIRHFGGMNI